MIPVTKPHLPPRECVDAYIDRIYTSGLLTNNGPLVQELTERLKRYLGVSHLLLVANGTLALQVAYAALGVRGAAITTPFTFPATSSSLAWQGVQPVYAGINPRTLNLDPTAAARCIDSSVSALVPVHTYGNPCDVEAFQVLAEDRGLKVVYDGSHAFGVTYKERSLLEWGDATTLSFHATKLFYTGEGGAIVFRRESDLEYARKLINFGLVDGVPSCVGINAKMSELHAAMGLAVLDDVGSVIARRVDILALYRHKLEGYVEMPMRRPQTSENGAYLPILLTNREVRDHVLGCLKRESIEGRAYFSPSLDSTSLYTEQASCLAQEASDRILCLPIYSDLSDPDVRRIADIVVKSMREVS
ncbi:DegT/DnrJ/EryC1/StrS family aminotransferase [Marinobacter sp. NFXS9]|uniref:DegT/DnrJ/EryC1/StrS family aminotransferase n=1 Tax=Marinobacter sp. NFXS9 TaxID=2818433 RepID=UPI0032E01BCF